MSTGGVGEEVLIIGYLSYLSQGICPMESPTAGIPARKKKTYASWYSSLLGLEFMISGGKGQHLPTEFLPAFLPVAKSESGELYCDFSKISLLSTSWKNPDAVPRSPRESYPSTVAW